jgi:hypothetical protein
VRANFEFGPNDGERLSDEKQNAFHRILDSDKGLALWKGKGLRNWKDMNCVTQQS